MPGLPVVVSAAPDVMTVEYDYVDTVELSALALRMMFACWPPPWRVGGYRANVDGREAICWKGIAWVVRREDTSNGNR